MKELLRERLLALASTKEMTPEQFQKIYGIVIEIVDEWREAKISEVEQMVKDWETTMTSDDKTLYSLGLRRAIDVFREESALDQLPVLEQEDTPDA